MASLCRPWNTRPIPADAERLTHKGKPAVRIKAADGKTVVRFVSASRPTHYRARCLTWYAQYSDALGKVRRESLGTASKDEARRALSQIEDREQARKAGRYDLVEEHASTPLADHLDAWELTLSAGGAGAKHVRTTIARARRIIERCQFVTADAIRPDRVQAELIAMRADASPVTVPLRESFKRSEAAAVLGVTPSAIPSLVARHRLPATGQGKNRRYPRDTVMALLAKRERGASVRTLNGYLTSLRAFVSWAVANKRMREDRLGSIRLGNCEADRRLERRFLSADEVRRLMDAARTSGRDFRGLTGADRELLYAVAVYTGFRAGELGKLTRECFELTSVTPVVRLSGLKTKNRKKATQPLPVELATRLGDYLARRATGTPVWPGSWHERAADMIRIDMMAANIPPDIVGTDGQTLVVDFHSLRHTCGILAEQGGASLREVMTLMRHSDPKLTMRIYGRLQPHDLAKTVQAMPAMFAARPDEAPDVALNVALNSPKVARNDTSPGGEREAREEMENFVEQLETLISKGFESSAGELTPGVLSSPEWIRTIDRRIRNPLLYPTELRDRPRKQGIFEHSDVSDQLTTPETPLGMLWEGSLIGGYDAERKDARQGREVRALLPHVRTIAIVPCFGAIWNRCGSVRLISVGGVEACLIACFGEGNSRISRVCDGVNRDLIAFHTDRPILDLSGTKCILGGEEWGDPVGGGVIAASPWLTMHKLTEDVK